MFLELPIVWASYCLRYRYHAIIISIVLVILTIDSPVNSEELIVDDTFEDAANYWNVVNDFLAKQKMGIRAIYCRKDTLVPCQDNTLTEEITQFLGCEQREAQTLLEKKQKKLKKIKDRKKCMDKAKFMILSDAQDETGQIKSFVSKCIPLIKGNFTNC